MYNRYQEDLAERSMTVIDDGNGETWSFRWYADPISKGLSDWTQYIVHVSEGFTAFHALTMPRNEEEMVEMDRAMQFVKARCLRIGSEEEEI